MLILFALNSMATVRSTRGERLAIKEGNMFFKEGEYAKAGESYKKALSSNPSSVYADFNLALTQIKLGRNAAGNKKNGKADGLLQEGTARMKKIAALSGEYSSIAAKANFNLGNMSFRQEDYAGAIGYYKQALRIDPEDDNARRNLRIAQLKQQGNKNKDQDKNKDNQDKKDNKNKDQDENKDDRQDKNKEQQPKQQPPANEKINPQTADQILKAMENKENATRTRLQRQGKKGQNQGRSRKNW